MKLAAGKDWEGLKVAEKGCREAMGRSTKGAGKKWDRSGRNKKVWERWGRTGKG